LKIELKENISKYLKGPCWECSQVQYGWIMDEKWTFMHELYPWCVDNDVRHDVKALMHDNY
jgi:hypothetical protein